MVFGQRCLDNPKFWCEVICSSTEDCEPEPLKQYWVNCCILFVKFERWLIWQSFRRVFGSSGNEQFRSHLKRYSQFCKTNNRLINLFAGSLKWRKTRTMGVIWGAELFPLVRRPHKTPWTSIERLLAQLITPYEFVCQVWWMKYFELFRVAELFLKNASVTRFTLNYIGACRWSLRRIERSVLWMEAKCRFCSRTPI